MANRAGRGWAIASLGLILAGGMVAAAAGVAMAASDSMVDFQFVPTAITVAAGDSITWTNNGQVPHTATADNGSFDTGPVDPGHSATVTFHTAGSFPFHCQFHGAAGGVGMSGVITVQAAGGGGGGSGGGSGGDSGGGGPLPQTATPLPLIAAGGLLLLVAGLLLVLRLPRRAGR
jgi:plastocyanin